jgi:hypothetical protein
MKRLFTTKTIFTVMALSVCFSRLQIQAFAQANQSSQKLLADSPNGPGANAAFDAASSTTVNTTNIEILKELQQMRSRIAELEAQLKAQQGGAPAVVNTTLTNGQPAAAVSSSLARPPVHESTEQESKVEQKPGPSVPFAFADWTWLNGNARNKDVVWDSKFFTPEIRFDANYISSFNHPQDDSLGGSTETFPMKSRSSRSASAAISTGRMSGQES